MEMIIATTRTLNEERNIERFCHEYGKIADRILIVDGGSTDKTISLARGMPKTEVGAFDERVYREDIWRNPHGKHINSIIAWANSYKPDWIIFDDCDSVPNRELSQRFPGYIDIHPEPIIKVHRAYIWGSDRWFPQLSTGACLWAWKPKAEIWACEADPWKHRMLIPEDLEVRSLLFPLALLHYSWPNKEEVARKYAFYRSQYSHDIQGPLEFGGPLQPLPEWART